MIKNVFYFILKALFVLKIFKFLSWFFGGVEKRLDLKDVNFKILPSQHEKKQLQYTYCLIYQEVKATRQ